jgi:hypothetical protein
VLTYLPGIVGSKPTSVSRSSNAVFIETERQTTVRVDNSDLRSIGLSVETAEDIITSEELLTRLEPATETGTRIGWEPTQHVGEADEYGAVCVGHRTVRHSYESQGRLPEHKLPGVQSLYLIHVEDEHATDRLTLRRYIRTD